LPEAARETTLNKYRKVTGKGGEAGSQLCLGAGKKKNDVQFSEQTDKRDKGAHNDGSRKWHSGSSLRTPWPKKNPEKGGVRNGGKQTFGTDGERR